VQSLASIGGVRKVSNSGETVSNIWLAWRGVLRSLQPRLEVEANRNCPGTLKTRQRTAFNLVEHAPSQRPVARPHTMNLLAKWALEEGRGAGLQHLVQTFTVEAMATEVKLPASLPLLLHVCQADCALIHRLHWLPLTCVQAQSVGGICCRVSLNWWWWITSKDGAVEREGLVAWLS